MRLWCVKVPKKLQQCLICVKGGCQLDTFKWNEPLVLCRYEKLPLDFRTPFIFNMENFPQPSNNAVPLSMAANRTASSTLASLSRYFLHQRWVWAVQSNQGSTVAMQAVAHILSMLSEWVHTLNLWWDMCFLCLYSVCVLKTFRHTTERCSKFVKKSLLLSLIPTSSNNNLGVRHITQLSFFRIADAQKHPSKMLRR